MPSIFEATAGHGLGPTNGVAVAQQTSKSTAVTANAECGRIVVHDESVDAGSSVNFVVNNDKIKPDDVVIVNLASSDGNFGSYLVSVDHVTLGSFQIQIRNMSTQTLSHGLVLNFVMLKGGDGVED